MQVILPKYNIIRIIIKNRAFLGQITSIPNYCQNDMEVKDVGSISRISGIGGKIELREKNEDREFEDGGERDVRI